MKRFGQTGFRGAALLLRCAAVAFILGSTTIAAAPAQRLAPVPTGFGLDGDQMGASIAVLGDTLVAGSPNAQPTFGISSGAAQVFRNGASGWEREALLVPSDVLSFHGFGSAVAIGENVVAIGAAGTSSSVTFVFRRDGADWTETNDLAFGGLPAIAGNELAIGGAAGVRVYEDQAGTWVPETDLGFDGDPSEERVNSVFFSDDVIAFTTTAHSIGTGDTVLLYFYTRIDGVWTRDTRIDLGLWFPGLSVAPSVAISNETAIIATGGTVEVHTRGDGGWGVEQALDPGVSWGDLVPVSVVIDGDRAAVGCGGYFAQGEQGSVIVFEKDGGVWSRVSRPYDVDGGAGDTFGATVALSANVLAVGSPGATVEGVASGKVTAIALDGATWTASPPLDEGNAQAGVQFGSSFAMSGGSAFVLSSEANFATVIHDFEVEGNQWVERTQLRSPSTVPYSSFGIAMALDGDTAAVASRSDRYDGTTNWSAVYIYARGDDGWQIVQRIEGDIMFGAALALDGDRLAIADVDNQGGPGRVFMFTRSGGTWTQQATIQPDDSAPADYFGSPLALSGDTLVVGNPVAASGIESNAGVAYVFVDAGGTWPQQARLTAPVPLQNRRFGSSVALSGDMLLVGAQRPTGVEGAVAFSFGRDAGTWTHDATLSLAGASDNEYQTPFGVALSDDATVAVITAPNGSTSGAHAGAAFVFRNDGTGWSPGSTLHGLAWPDGTDGFGSAIVISGSDAMISAPIEYPGGAVYVIPVGETVFANGFD